LHSAVQSSEVIKQWLSCRVHERASLKQTTEQLQTDLYNMRLLGFQWLVHAAATSPAKVVHEACEVAKCQPGLLQVEQVAGPRHHVVQLHFFQVNAQGFTCHLQSSGIARNTYYRILYLFVYTTPTSIQRAAMRPSWCRANAPAGASGSRHLLDVGRNEGGHVLPVEQLERRKHLLLRRPRRRLQPPALFLQILGCLFPLCCRLCRWSLGLAAAAAGHVLTLAVCARR
jgi:hypothetical protein